MNEYIVIKASLKYPTLGEVVQLPERAAEHLVLGGFLQLKPEEQPKAKKKTTKK